MAKSSNKKDDVIQLSKKDLDKFKKDIVLDVKEVFKDEISRINFPRKSYFWKVFFLVLIISLVSGYFIFPIRYKKAFKMINNYFKRESKIIIKQSQVDDNLIALDSKQVVSLFSRIKSCENELGENYYLKNNLNNNLESKMLISCTLTSMPKENYINTGVKYNDKDILKVEVATLKKAMTKFFNYDNLDLFVNSLKFKMPKEYGFSNYINVNYDPLNNHYIIFQEFKDKKTLENYYLKLVSAREERNEIILKINFVVVNFTEEESGDQLKVHYEVFKDFNKKELISTEKVLTAPKDEVEKRANIKAYLDAGGVAEIVFVKAGENYIFKESKIN